MRKYKIRMIISIMVTVILLAYAIMPILSIAENETLDMELTKVEIDGAIQIKVAASSPSKILALSYVNEKKTISDFNGNAEAIVAYFEGENATPMNITSENYINETIDATQFGTYTVYLRNLDGEIQLSYITINDKNAIILEVSEQNVNNIRNIVVKARSTSRIVAVKVQKTDDATKPANFTNVTNLLNEEKDSVELSCPVTELGIYQVYVQDANGNNKIQTINIFEGESPITINSTVNGNTVTINVVDTIADIQILKIAKQSEIATILDFENKGTVIEFTGTNNINVDYSVTEQGNYIIYAKDNAGNSLMTSVTICEEPTQTMQFYRLSSDLSKIYVIAENNINNINFAKYMISQEKINIQTVKEQGKQLPVVEGKKVILEINESGLNDSDFVNVYVSDTLGFGALRGITVNGIKVVDNLPGEQDNNNQPNQNPDDNENLEQIPTIPDQGNTPGQTPTTPDQGNTPGQTPTTPDQGNTPGQTPTTPEEFPDIPDVDDTNPDEFPTIPDVDNTPTTPDQGTTPEQTPTTPDQGTTPEQTPTTPDQGTTPEQTPTTPDQGTTPEQTPTTPDQGTTPEQTPTTPDQGATPEQTPTTPDQGATPEQTPTIPDQGTTPEQTPSDDGKGPVDITDIENEGFDEIQDINNAGTSDKTQTNSSTITMYPQTGENNYIIFIGIAISSAIAVISYRKMKQEERM